MPILFVATLIVYEMLLVIVHLAVYATLAVAFGIGSVWLAGLFVILALTFVSASFHQTDECGTSGEAVLPRSVLSPTARCCSSAFVLCHRRSNMVWAMLAGYNMLPAFLLQSLKLGLLVLQICCPTNAQ